MNKTTIDWATHSINPVKGLCPMACTYCYARKMYRRFHWDETIRYDDMVWQTGPHIPTGSRVFVGSTMELFGPWIPSEWIRTILDYVESMPSTTFIFLTKNPKRLKEFNPWPSNAWVGISVDTHQRAFSPGYDQLGIVDAPVRFISAEPLLSRLLGSVPDYVNWLIIGAQTQPTWLPERAWVEEIERAADDAGIPVFEKASLTPLFPDRPLRRVLPT